MKHSLIVATLLSILLTNFTATYAGSLSNQSLKYGGVTRHYSLFIPSGYKKSKPSPLLIGLHAGMGNPTNFIQRTGFSTIAEQENFIAVFPQGSAWNEKRGRFVWNAGSCCGYAADKNIDDVGFIRVLINKLMQRYNIDGQSIYATGFSNGGEMSYRLACELSDQIASIAVISGSLVVDKCTLKNPVNILHIHGTADKYTLYEGGLTVSGFSKAAKNSVEKSLEIVRDQNQCAETPVTKRHNDMIFFSYSCHKKSRVAHIRISNGEHAWPGSTIRHRPRKRAPQKTTPYLNASEKIWAFFRNTSEL